MFWAKKEQDAPTPEATVKAPIIDRPITRDAPARGTTRLPRSGEHRTVTAKDLPEMLLAHADVTREQLRHALKTQSRTGEFIGEILVAEGVLDENSLVAFLARHCKIPHLSLLDYLIDESLFDLVPPDLCLRHRLVPIDKMGRNLTVAMVNPLDAEALATLHERWPELSIKPILCTAKHFNAVARNLFEKQSGKLPHQKLAYTEEQELLADSMAPHQLRPAPGTSLDVADVADDESKRLPSEAPMASEEELPPPAGFNDVSDVFDPPPVETCAQHFLLGTVFGATSDGIPEESGDGLSPDGSVNIGKMTRKMTAAMVQSMRNTYSVLARRFTLFRGLDPESVARLFACGKTLEYDAGQVVFHKGELGRCMYVILSGTVDILDGGRLLARLEHGGNFGEMALLSNAARSASAKAVEPTSVLVLNFADITQELDSLTSVQLLLNITVILSSRLRRAQAL